MRKGSLIGIGIVSAIIVVAVIVASSYGSGGPRLSAAQDGSGDDHLADNDTKATSAGAIRQVMTLRTDLSGSVIVSDRPFFLQLRDSIDPGNGSVVATEVVKVTGGVLGDVDVRTFEAGSTTTSWSPVNATDGVEGALTRAEGIYFPIVGNVTTLMMITIGVPGTYTVSVNATDAVNGTSLAPPVTMSIVVQGAAASYLFDRPSVSPGYMSEWSLRMSNGSSMSFTVASNTTPLWKSTEVYPAMYNWTVTVINPDGMIAYDNLSEYNAGNPTLDPANLINTSVDSTWSWGVGSPLHVIWDHTHGARMEGSAVTTPTTKELYQGGTQAAWADGTWEPYGDGDVTFHQTGHYIFMFTLTKNGQAVSEPLVLETIVS
ncbi:MAG: hypothetical protein SA339_01370 [Methanomassiliicoccus sp.]|nr:hypothetical protein [Methanomassiliicoccus sp.]